MSALAAVLERGGGVADEQLAGRILAAMSHRGSDGRAVRAHGPAAIAQASLWTTPEDAGVLPPLSNPRGTLLIVADARIDNRDEILGRCPWETDRYRDANPSGRPLSDAEIILLAYERWGSGCAAHLRGDFAFVIWDIARREMHCARDHLGVKPLFYRCDALAFRCASEPAALFAEPGFVRHPHWSSLALFLAEAYTENEQTLYDGVHALPGGHTLRVSPTKRSLARYWTPDRCRRWEGASDEQYAERFHELFAKAVRARMRTHGPAGLHVSGGHDSSSVAVEAAALWRSGRAGEVAPTILRLSFSGLECDETAYSDAVVAKTELPSATVSALVDEDALTPHLDPAHPDLYFLPTTNFLLPLLRVAASRGIRTTLTGHGGDHLLNDSGLSLAASLRAGRLRLAAEGTGLWQRPWSPASWRRFARTAIQASPHPLSVAYARSRLRSAAPSPPWLTRRAWHAVLDRTYDVRRAVRAPRSPDPAVRADWDALDGRYLKYALGQWDRYAARVGAEHRHPFLDVDLLELVLSMPEEQRFVPGADKAKPVLRRMMRNLLPEVILTRRDSATYNCYIELALERSHHQLMGLFANSRLSQAGLVDGEVVRRVLSAPADRGRFCIELMNLTALELWLRNVHS